MILTPEPRARPLRTTVKGRGARLHSRLGAAQDIWGFLGEEGPGHSGIQAESSLLATPLWWRRTEQAQGRACGIGCTLASGARPSHANHGSNQAKLEERTVHHWCPRHPWSAANPNLSSDYPSSQKSGVPINPGTSPDLCWQMLSRSYIQDAFPHTRHANYEAFQVFIQNYFAKDGAGVQRDDVTFLKSHSG